MNVLLIGTNISWVNKLNEYDSLNLYIVEEKDIWNKRNLGDVLDGKITKAYYIEYQLNEEAYKDVMKVANEVKANIIIPGVEYAVQCATLASSELGLPGLGTTAAYALTNKIKLRNALKESPIQQPQYQQVETAEDVRDFFLNINQPIILKPANRQASTGVIKIFDEKDIDAAWEHTLSASEGVFEADRTLEWEYIVEEIVQGREISTETIVKDGVVAFHNITCKHTSDGPYPVELGHYLPADVNEKQRQKVNDYINHVIDDLNIENGILHSEWIMDNEDVYLVECAGRAPGDFIFDLIKMKEGQCPYEITLKLLADIDAQKVYDRYPAVAIHFIIDQPGGIVEKVTGKEDVLADPDTVNLNVFAKPGWVIRDLTSSWSRLGYLITKGASGQQALEKAEELSKKIKIVTESKVKS
ncbi:ATP-grasp domain-containing protein [Caldalkalibacillus salinus]|uniref:ATP-grasp domain-containing protein n=1 Tax=Caldalkalibacillus salinus TaxID=2803787 RepID=UPI0019248C88|nr:ATP-grasp domain-containing protein [Caldalkalibacillus salinus]